MRKKVDNDLQEMGKRIQRARLLSGMTQEQLAECVDVTPQYLSDLERGIVGTSVNTLKKLCVKLGVTSDSILFGGSSSPAASATLYDRISSLPDEQRMIVEKGVGVLFDAIKTDPNSKAN